jgi:hypothetical protein
VDLLLLSHLFPCLTAVVEWTVEVVVVVVPKVVHSAELQQGGAVKVLLM